MPRRRRRDKTRTVFKLTPQQEAELLFGVRSWDAYASSSFASVFEARAGWWANRSSFMVEDGFSGGGRPDGFWVFEAPALGYDGSERQGVWLARHGMLTGREVGEIRDYAARFPEQGWLEIVEAIDASGFYDNDNEGNEQ